MDGGSGLWLSTKRRSILSCMQSRYCLTFRNLKPLLANQASYTFCLIFGNLVDSLAHQAHSAAFVWKHVILPSHLLSKSR